MSIVCDSGLKRVDGSDRGAVVRYLDSYMPSAAQKFVVVYGSLDNLDLVAGFVKVQLLHQLLNQMGVQ